jgi:hypothetical protein
MLVDAARVPVQAIEDLLMRIVPPVSGWLTKSQGEEDGADPSGAEGGRESAP